MMRKSWKLKTALKKIRYVQIKELKKKLAGEQVNGKFFIRWISTALGRRRLAWLTSSPRECDKGWKPHILGYEDLSSFVHSISKGSILLSTNCLIQKASMFVQSSTSFVLNPREDEEDGIETKSLSLT